MARCIRRSGGEGATTVIVMMMTRIAIFKQEYRISYYPLLFGGPKIAASLTLISYLDSLFIFFLLRLVTPLTLPAETPRRAYDYRQQLPTATTTTTDGRPRTPACSSPASLLLLTARPWSHPARPRALPPCSVAAWWLPERAVVVACCLAGGGGCCSSARWYSSSGQYCLAVVLGRYFALPALVQ